MTAGPADRAPCIIGAAQQTWRPVAGEAAPEPLYMWASVAGAAAADTGVPADRVLKAAGRLAVIYCQSWPYDDPAGRLAAELRVAPPDLHYSGIGGTTPHRLITAAGQDIASGHLDAAVIVSGEALDTVRRLKKAGERPAWSHRDPEKKPFPFEEPFHPAEVNHSVFQAWLTFALFDIARRAHLGTEPDDYTTSLGELLSPMSEVAASNPYAWFATKRSPEELIRATPSNRMVGYPYTKTMVAVMDVDMAASVIVASHEAANRLGVPHDRRVYLRGAAEANDPAYVAQHDPMWASPAMATAASQAMAGAGIGIDEVSHLDLYSCFASSLNFACDGLDVNAKDPRGLTVTGGLPFAGGPGSGYVLHSTAAMVDVLRRDPGSFGLVSGVGMHMTKHAFGLYSSSPPPGGGTEPLASARHTATPLRTRPICEVHTGPARIGAYTVVHDRSGDLDWGVAVCDLPGSPERIYARVEDPGMLACMEDEEWVGRTVRVESGDDRVNRIVGEAR